MSKKTNPFEAFHVSCSSRFDVGGDTAIDSKLSDCCQTVLDRGGDTCRTPTCEYQGSFLGLGPQISRSQILDESFIDRRCQSRVAMTSRTDLVIRLPDSRESHHRDEFLACRRNAPAYKRKLCKVIEMFLFFDIPVYESQRKRPFQLPCTLESCSSRFDTGVTTIDYRALCRTICPNFS